MKKGIYFIAAVLVVVLAGFTIYFMGENGALETRISTLENQLEKSGSVDVMQDEVVIAFAKADSLAATGNYEKALASYKQLQPQNSYGLAENRIKLINQMNRLQNQNQLLRRQAGDTLEENVMPVEDTSLEKMDSLSFALEKAQLQVKNLQNQLIRKSFGEYITFKSTKGNRLFYVGEVEGGKADGYGIAILDSGSRYEGQWKNNKRHGEGKFYWVDGERYEGSYKNDVRSGQGTYYWPNGQKYVGSWKDDKRNGQGKFYDKDGDLLTQGTWKNDDLVEEK